MSLNGAGIAGERFAQSIEQAGDSAKIFCELLPSLRDFDASCRVRDRRNP